MFEQDNQLNDIDNINNEQNEQIPSIICKKRQGYAEVSNRYHYTPEENYYKVTNDEQKQVYRWSMEDEEQRHGSKNSHTMTKTVSSATAAKPRGRIGLKIFAVAMSLMFVLSALGTIGVLVGYINGDLILGNGREFEPLTIVVPSVDEQEQAQGLLLFDSVGDVIDKVRPSVVSIQAEIEVRSGFWGRGGTPFTQTGVGTGFILTEDGYIATNYHVIEGATNIMVKLYNGRRYPATLVGGDAVADIAVIRVNARNLIPARLGNSDSMREGDFVVAIGSPGGLDFAGSSTFGIISGINRDIQVSRGRNMTLLQHDAAINPGNSGGPLVNMRGEVIGVNTLKLASSSMSLFGGINYEGMGFAIPITVAVERFNDIIANPGEVNRLPEETIPRIYDERDTSEVSFGIAGGTVSAELMEMFDLPQGFWISAIVPDGAADRAGIMVHDVIIALDGVTVESFEDVIELKPNYAPGDEAVVTVYRDGEILDLPLIFDARSD